MLSTEMPALPVIFCFEVSAEDHPAARKEILYNARAKNRSYVHIKTPIPFCLTVV